MSNTQYVFMEDMTHAAAVLDMMHRLYTEDDTSSGVDESLFPQTIQGLLRQPQVGRIALLHLNGKLYGYALLIPYWSNEFGGFLAYLDELYVMAEARCQGLGRGLIQWLIDEKPFGAVAIFLEVTPHNLRARRLYEQIGFRDRENRTMALRLSK